MTQISADITDNVLVARIGNPPAGYMNEDTANELIELLDTIESNPAIRAVVFTGSLDDVFIRHYDVALLEQRGREMAAKGYTFKTSRPIPESPYLTALRRIDTMPKPFIAAINGTAMGGGFELALACDIRLVKSGSYQLGLPEINIGLLPGAGGTQRLARLIGEAKALELIMTGTTFSPQQACDLGIASRCVDGDVLTAAMETANVLAAKHPTALAHVKYLIKGSTQRELETGLADERTLFCDLMVNADSLDAMAKMNTGNRAITDKL